MCFIKNFISKESVYKMSLANVMNSSGKIASYYLDGVVLNPASGNLDMGNYDITNAGDVKTTTLSHPSGGLNAVFVDAPLELLDTRGINFQTTTTNGEVSSNGALEVNATNELFLSGNKGVSIQNSLVNTPLLLQTPAAPTKLIKQMLLSEPSYVILDNQTVAPQSNAEITLPVDMPVGYTVTVCRLDSSGQNDLIKTPAGYAFSNYGGGSVTTCDMDNTGTVGVAGNRKSITFVVSNTLVGGNKILLIANFA